MQYCSLQHRTLLLSPVTSTTEYRFCFGSIPSFFLELFLHWSPVAYWAPIDLGSSSFSILSFCLFILFMGFSRQEYWCFWSVVLEKTLESPLDCKEIQPVHPKGDQVLGVHWKDWCWGWNSNTLATSCKELTHWKKNPDAGRDWSRRKRGTTEDEMAGQHHWLDAHEFGWTLGVGDGQGGLACCDSCGRKESDTTEQLNWTEYLIYHGFQVLPYAGYSILAIFLLPMIILKYVNLVSKVPPTWSYQWLNHTLGTSSSVNIK